MVGLIVHEWLGRTGGSERVVDGMREAFPDARLVALWNDAPDKYPEVLESWLARTPLRRHKAAALPFMLTTWRHLIPPNDDVDWLLVSSHLFAHHIDVRRSTGDEVPKYVYVHTPGRYIWEPQLDGRGRSAVVRTAAPFLRPLDRGRASEARKLAANSQFVRERIRRSWRRDATVIYPPVDVERIERTPDWRRQLTDQEASLVDHLPPGFLLGASRFIPYKRLDDVIRTGATLGRPVVLAGSGPEELRLRAIAQESGVPVEFIINPSDELLYTLYQQSAAYIFPAVDDFGIMPVEAIAAGAHVVVGPIGGAAESIRLSKAGTVAESDDIRAFADATRASFDMEAPSSRSVKSLFGTRRFIEQIRGWVDD